MRKRKKNPCLYEGQAKIKYKGEDQAIRSLIALWRKFKFKDAIGDYHVYECPSCKKWHIGHRPGLSKIKVKRSKEIMAKDLIS